MKKISDDWKIQHIIRMWPRALFHTKEGKEILKTALAKSGVYVLYREDRPYYIGKTFNPLYRRLRNHALQANWRRYNFWNYFSAFEIDDRTHISEVEAILISAMPTANSARPKIPPFRLNSDGVKLLNRIQALRLSGRENTGDGAPDDTPDQDDDET